MNLVATMTYRNSDRNLRILLQGCLSALGRIFVASLLLVLPIGAAQGQQSPERGTNASSRGKTISAPKLPARKDPKILAAENYLKLGDFQKALDALDSVVHSNPRCDPEVYVMLARCRLELGEKSQAIEACELGMDVFPCSASIEKFYVGLLREASTRQEMKTKLAGNLRRCPQSTIFMKSLGELLLEENPLNSQIESLLKTAADGMPSDPEVHYLYGQWACLNDRSEVSVQELKKALALTQSNEQARMQIYTYLGIAYDHLDRPSEADLAFQKAMAFNRMLSMPVPGTAMQYAAFLQKRLREPEAQSVIVKILKWAPSFAPAHIERAKYLAKQRKMEEALREGELALKHAGDDISQQRAAHVFLAKTCFALGRTIDSQLHQKWLESHE